MCLHYEQEDVSVEDQPTAFQLFNIVVNEMVHAW